MKNIKVKNKLLIGFSIVLAFTVIISAMGIIGLATMNSGGETLYNRNVAGVVKAYDMLVNLTGQRTSYRNVILAMDPNYDMTVDDAITSLRSTENSMKTLMDDYGSWATLPDAIKAFSEYKAFYESDYHEGKEYLVACVQSGDTKDAMAALVQMAPEYDQMSNLLHAIVDVNTNAAGATAESNAATYHSLLVVQIILVAIAVVVAVFLTIYLSFIICKPLRILMGYMQDAGNTGYLTPTDEEDKVFSETITRKDELGKCIKASMGFVGHVVNIAKELEIIAGGDLTHEFALLSSRDEMGMSLQKMTQNLNEMFMEVNNASNQVSVGSKQVADGSQALSVSSTEQAASIEQLSSSVSEIAANTTRNADMAKDAANLSGIIKGNAEKGSAQMENMMGAVKDINDASNSISKVIKVIDDIAFQTNILALNAAVEAARAGQHGKGFAVVAEEVRSLAAKSAEAAKDTGALIANSMEKAQLGAKIASETSASLEDIVAGINKSSEIIFQISKLSDEQATAISQISVGIDNVASMVQQTSATSEESAAASEEMSGQASLLLELIRQFKVKGDSHRTIAAPKRKELASSNPVANDDFGKY